jgi:hypothetical protein
MQVYFLLEKVDVDPALEQFAPAFTAPYAGYVREAPKNEINTTKEKHFFMTSDYLALLDLSSISVLACRSSLDFGAFIRIGRYLISDPNSYKIGGKSRTYIFI